MELAALIVSIVAVLLAGVAFLLGEKREQRRETLDEAREQRDRMRFGMEERREARDEAATQPKLDIPNAPTGAEPDGQHWLVARVTVHNLTKDVPVQRVVVTLTVAGKQIAESDPQTFRTGGVFELRIPRSEVEHLQGAWIVFKGGDWLVTARDASGATATWPHDDG